MRVLVAVVCLVLLAVVACFKPSVQDGGYQCNPSDNSCPPGFGCRMCDHHCWRDPTVPCGFTADASVTVDAPFGTPDARTDARFDAFVADVFTADIPDSSGTKDLPTADLCHGASGSCDPTQGDNCMNCSTCGACVCAPTQLVCNPCGSNANNCVNCPSACGPCATTCNIGGGLCSTANQCETCPQACLGGCPPACCTTGSC